jgi:branched-chain amino acid transport system substrate-binding protein
MKSMQCKSAVLLIMSFVVASLMVFSFGCVKKEEKEIKIGAILPLTGDAAKYGQSAKKGMELAIDEINAKGGINNKKLKLIIEDSQGQVKDGISAFNKLITVDKVPMVIGELLSSITLAMAPIANEKKVVVLSPASTAPKITEAGDYIFRNVASDIVEGQIMAEYAFKKLKLNKIAIMYINNDYGEGLRDAFKQEFTRLGGLIIDAQAFDQASVDFRSQLIKIKRSNPEAIYLIGYKESGRILKESKELGINVQFMGTVLFEDPEILKVAGNAANGVLYSSRAYNPESGDSVVKAFVNSYKNRYKEVPDIFAGLSYDAINIASLAIKNGGYISDGIKKSLYQIQHFHGVTGDTSFDSNGDAVQPAAIKKIENGNFIWVE